MMNKLLQDIQNLHRAPDDWDLEVYAPHAWRATRNVWIFMIGLCIVLGAVLPPHNPAKMFDEYRPFTIYTVILLAICGVVCAQCARLAGNRGRDAWVLMAIGFSFLAVDDLTGIHERLDKILNHSVGFDPKATLPDLLDAGIVVLYGIIGVIVLFYHRHHFFKLEGFPIGITRAAGAAVAMVILDVLGDLANEQLSKVLLGILEDSLEALAVSYFFWTFVTARFQLRRPDEFPRRAAPAPVEPVAGTADE